MLSIKDGYYPKTLRNRIVSSDYVILRIVWVRGGGC